MLETNPRVRFTIVACTGALARMCAARNTRRDVFAWAVDRGASTVEPAQVRLSFRFPRASSGEYTKIGTRIESLLDKRNNCINSANLPPHPSVFTRACLPERGDRLATCYVCPSGNNKNNNSGEILYYDRTRLDSSSDVLTFRPRRTQACTRTRSTNVERFSSRFVRSRFAGW